FMPNDVFTLNALTHELCKTLMGGRIDKVTQPEKDEIMLTIRAGQTNHLLVISVNSNNPRLHLTTRKKDNPYTAPPFAMHLRRHIVNSKIEGVYLVADDRIACFELKGKTELFYETKFYLYVELIGRYSNIILTDAENVISDSLKHITPEDNLRCVLPRMKYELPQQAKISPFDSESIIKSLSLMSGTALYDYIFKNISGFASSTLLEIIYRAGLDPMLTTLFEEEVNIITCEITKMLSIFNSSDYAPCISLNSAGKYEDYYILPYLHTQKSFLPMESLNEAIDLLTSEKDKELRLKNSGKSIAAALKAAIVKAQRYLKHARLKLEECANTESFRISGELINANIHNIKKGAEKISLFNYYENKDTVIQLNPQLNAQENAQHYYKKYSKLKRTFTVATTQVEENTQLLNYLMSVQQSFLMAEESKDLAEIEEELVKNGIMQKEVKKTAKVKAMPPAVLTKFVIEGFTVYRGKNNIQNDKLTFKTATESDIWLHVKAFHGSHTVIISCGKKVPDSVIVAAAEIAAYYSEQRNNTKVMVDYTERRNVRRHPSQKCGMVTYTNFNSVTVNPDSHENNILNNN
ncbi:MAG: DUF814 domain-containing protein, partial [Clostridia bacterium]|nr:DUF814 domain-containing protein [Clostridia bacterium]